MELLITSLCSANLDKQSMDKHGLFLATKGAGVDCSCTSRILSPSMSGISAGQNLCPRLCNVFNFSFRSTHRNFG